MALHRFEPMIVLSNFTAVQVAQDLGENVGSFSAVCENCEGTVDVRYNLLLGTKGGRCVDCGAIYKSSEVRLLRPKARFTMPKGRAVSRQSHNLL